MSATTTHSLPSIRSPSGSIPCCAGSTWLPRTTLAAPHTLRTHRSAPPGQCSVCYYFAVPYFYQRQAIAYTHGALASRVLTGDLGGRGGTEDREIHTASDEDEL